MDSRGTGVALVLALATATAAADEPYGRVVSALSLIFDDRGAGDPDRAVLVDAGCRYDLYLYYVGRRGRDWSAPPTLVKRGLDAGPACGEGMLKAGPGGALELTIANDWRPPMSKETLVIRYRNGEFVVAAYRSWTSRFSGPDPSKDAKRDATCAIDFLGGKAVRDGKAEALNRPAPRLADWDGAVCPD